MPKLKKNRRNHQVKLMLLIFFTFFVLTSCGNNKNLTPTVVPANNLVSPASKVSNTPSALPTVQQGWEYRWLQGIPCRAPCWEGITPGVTTAKEALDILTRNPLITPAKLGSVINNFGYINWSWTDRSNIPNNFTGKISDALYYTQKQEQTIFLLRPDFRVSFRLEQIILAYGQPTHIIATIIPNPDLSKSYCFWVIYMSQGITAEYVKTTKNPSEIPALSPNTLIEKVSFFIPNIEGFKEVYQRDNLLIAWQGFKGFDYYCQDSPGYLGECKKLKTL